MPRASIARNTRRQQGITRSAGETPALGPDCEPMLPDSEPELPDTTEEEPSPVVTVPPFCPVELVVPTSAPCKRKTSIFDQSEARFRGFWNQKLRIPTPDWPKILPKNLNRNAICSHHGRLLPTVPVPEVLAGDPDDDT